MNEMRRSLDRIERLVEVRQTYVTAAEAAVREAEVLVRYFEEEAVKNVRQIQQTREDIAYLKSLSGYEIQVREKHIFSLKSKARQIAQDFEKAGQLLDQRRSEWREKMKDKKIVERVQERRLQEWERSVDVLEQKQVDEMSVGRHARNRSSSANEPDAIADAGTRHDPNFHHADCSIDESAGSRSITPC
jgi:flagellar export protein FliJ